MTEAEFQRAVMELAKWCGWLTYHPRPAQTGGRWSTAYTGDAGFPDLVLAHRDRGTIFAELKTQRGRPTPGQRAWLNVLEDAGQEAYLWCPEHWDAITARLMGEENRAQNPDD